MPVANFFIDFGKYVNQLDVKFNSLKLVKFPIDFRISDKPIYKISSLFKIFKFPIDLASLTSVLHYK